MPDWLTVLPVALDTVEMVPSKDEFGVELMGAAAVVEESVVNIGPVGVETTLAYANVCTMVVVVV